VFTGVGVAGLGAALAFDLAANSQVSTDNKTCAPTCPHSDVTSIYTKWDLAGASLGVGIVALGVATYFFVSGAMDHGDSKHGSLRFDFAPSSGRAGAAARRVSSASSRSPSRRSDRRAATVLGAAGSSTISPRQSAVCDFMQLRWTNSGRRSC